MLRLLVVFAACLFLLPRSAAQGPPTDASEQTELGKFQGARLHVTVLSVDQRPLDRQSVVKLYSESKKTTRWLTTTGHSEAEFADLSSGLYDVEASAVGYVSAHKEVEVASLFGTAEVAVIVERDPSAIDLDATDSLISPETTKQMKRAVKALKSGDLEKAQKSLAETYKLAPSSAPLNFLFGYLFFQKKDYQQAESYLTRATGFDPHYGEALTLLGRVQLLQGQYERAKPTVEQALAANPNSWMAHNLLADVYLQQHDYNNAQQQAQFAIDQGQRAATGAQFVLGVSLAHLGRTQEALEVLKQYLQTAPQGETAGKAQQFITALEKGPRVVEATPAAIGEETSTTTSLLADAKAVFPETAWQPLDIDRVKPAIASGTPCPAEKVLDEAGRRVEQLGHGRDSRVWLPVRHRKAATTILAW